MPKETMRFPMSNNQSLSLFGFDLTRLTISGINILNAPRLIPSKVMMKANNQLSSLSDLN